jgi:signal transduction histidine kinase
VPYQIQQLFQNLIANSLKFTRKDVQPQIAVTHEIIPEGEFRNKKLGSAPKYLQITFEDNGIGFSNKAREQIFRLFERLHNRSEYEGSGLGLAICQRIAENHQGSIEADSEEGKGSKFIITLPYANSSMHDGNGSL